MKSLLTVQTFGAIDADADELLQNAFQNHEAYTSLLAHKKFIITGRKGSGKTAIFRTLTKRTDFNVFAFGYTFADYPWHHHRLQERVGVPTEQRYVSSWVYLVLLSAANVLLNRDQSQPWSEHVVDDLAALEKFVIDSYGTRQPLPVGLFTPTRKLKFKGGFKIPIFDTSADLSAESYPVSELPTIIAEVNRTVADAIVRCLNPEFDYYFCFDELDRSFDPNDEAYKAMLIGLLLAAKQLSEQARSAGKRFSVGVLLRDDIYDLLKFEDKNKLTERYVSRIEWDSPRTKWSLRQVMEGRFEAVLGDSTSPVKWTDVFDESQEMSGRQSKYSHILDRTFRRPRDIIKFCNSVLQAYRDRSPDSNELFTNQDIISARSAYSDYLLRELEDEIHKHVPRFADYIELVKTLDGLQFTRDEFESKCTEHPELLAKDDSPSTILKNLFEFSVLGYQRRGGVTAGSQYIWRHVDPTARFDETATSLRVHPGFMEAFGLKKFRHGDSLRR